MSRQSSPALSAIRLVLFALLTLASIPVQVAALVLKSRVAVTFPPLYHRAVIRILGFRTTTYGEKVTGQPTIYVSNHVSYIDIEILGALVQGSFVAKSEVRQWPVFGLLARLQQSVFVDRRARSSVRERDTMTGRLQQGDNLILFPEGTSSDGQRIRPFKSTLLSAAETRVGGGPVMVQPISIAYTRLNGMPIGRAGRVLVAWFGDMDLAPHLWTMVGLGIVEVVVQFHPPVTVDMLGSRKQLAAHCERVIADGLAAANAGRLKPASPAAGQVAPAAGNAVAAS